jgi:predicted transcriptional regulator
LECLKALWQLGHGSVRDVLELVKNRKLAYTTVMTVLDRLEKRGGVTRHKQGRAFIYQPKLTREALRQLAVKDLVDTFFEGSGQALLEYLRSTPERTQDGSAVEASPARDDGGMEPALL